MVFDGILNPIFGPLLKLPSLWTIMILSFLISLIITLIQKYATDQNRLKEIKEEMKSIQKRIKEEKDPNEKMKIQKEHMKLVPEQLKHSMKSMMYTFIPIILIFSWMNANLAYDPILPGEEFTVTVNFETDIEDIIELSAPQGVTIDGPEKKEIEDEGVKWVLRGNKGEYLLQFIIENQIETKEVLITEEQRYKMIEKTKKSPLSFFPPKEPYLSKDSKIKSIKIDNKPKKILNIFGWKIGWLGTYIIFSIIFSILIRRLIKVY